MHQPMPAAGPGVDSAVLARQLAAQLPDDPQPTGGMPPAPDFDPVPGSGDFLYDVVQMMIEGDTGMAEVMQGVFNAYVGDAMLYYAWSREQATAEACAIVERAVAEAKQ